jgi:hypothetical protein
VNAGKLPGKRAFHRSGKHYGLCCSQSSPATTIARNNAQ